MSVQRLKLPTVREVPNFDRSIQDAASQTLAIGTQTKGQYRIAMTCQRTNLLTRSCVPQLDHRPITGAGQLFSVGAEATDWTVPVWPLSVPSSLPVSTSQS